MANEKKIERTRVTCVLAVVVTTALTACSTGTGVGGKTAAGVERSRDIVHAPCDVEASNAERVDANGDGKPDITVVSEGGKELCRATDLDFDGRVDLFTYYGAAGQPTRRELDYDRDGAIDEIQLFKDGVLTEKHRSSTLAKRLDTWETYEQGRLVKAERDADGNGRIDQWWEYKTADCPVISTDTDGNGLPDPTAQVDFCSESSYSPPEQATPTTAPVLQKETQALPTETSSKTVTEPEDSTKNTNSSEGTKKQGQPANSDKGQTNEK